jgi:hypothetical protein
MKFKGINVFLWNNCLRFSVTQGWQRQVLLEKPSFTCYYRPIDVVLQEFLVNNQAYDSMNFQIEGLTQTNDGKRVYRDWRTGDWGGAC